MRFFFNVEDCEKDIIICNTFLLREKPLPFNQANHVVIVLYIIKTSECNQSILNC